MKYGAPLREAITKYRVNRGGHRGPVIDRMPTDMMDMAKVPALGYTSVIEALASASHDARVSAAG